MICSIAGVMGAIGDRWGLVIPRDLVFGLSRYDDFRQSSGVTNATLSDRLKHLEANGLIERRRYQVNPERFEYLSAQWRTDEPGIRVPSIESIDCRAGKTMSPPGSQDQPQPKDSEAPYRECNNESWSSQIHPVRADHDIEQERGQSDKDDEPIEFRADTRSEQ